MKVVDEQWAPSLWDDESYRLGREYTDKNMSIIMNKDLNNNNDRRRF